MGTCIVCGKFVLFKSAHAACLAKAEPSNEFVEDTGDIRSEDVSASVYGSISAKMDRPYELEGSRIERVVANVNQFKREGRLEEAIPILLAEMDLWERDSAAGLGGVAPWYYEQAAIIYRKLRRHDDEIAVLERFAAQQHAPGASPPRLLERLDKAKWYALKRAGVDTPRPPIFDQKFEPRKEMARPTAVRIAKDQVPVRDFIALDVETANADFASICSIGLVHFRAGQVFKSLTIFVDPEDEFDPINISIHGITPEMVVGKPTIAKVFPVITSSLKDVVVVHHSHFDKTAMRRAAARYGVEELPCVWLDTLRVARRAWPHFAEDGNGYGLARLAREFRIEFNHHDAAEDARAAGLLLHQAIDASGLGIVEWVGRVEQPIFGGDRGKHARQGDATGPLSGEVIVFTGTLQIPRAHAAEIAAKAGCDVADSVTKKTTILVVGDVDLRATRSNERSTKHRKAEQLILAGSALRIVGESDFLRMIDSVADRADTGTL
jgi:DNA polymerase III subunit epsilon